MKVFQEATIILASFSSSVNFSLPNLNDPSVVLNTACF